MGKLKISCRRKSLRVVSYQVVTEPCCGLSVIFSGFISDLIGRETINIPEIFSGVHGFMGKTVKILANLTDAKIECHENNMTRKLSVSHYVGN